MELLENEAICKAFGDFVKRGRKKTQHWDEIHLKYRPLYQKEVATLLGITQAHYSWIESGKRAITLTQALNICKVLSLDFNDFIYGMGRTKARVKPKQKENSTSE
jgi:transcriptional regulator with XRE-family HTH domain